LEGYLSKGGKLLVLLPPTFTQAENGDLTFKSTGLEPLLKKYDVAVQDDLIVGVEMKLGMNEQGELVRVPEITTKVVADQFDASCKLSAPLAGKRVLFYDARPVKALADNPHMAATEFLKSPPKAYFTTKTARIKEPPKEKVSIPLGVAVEPKGDLKDKATRLVVIGSSAPASNIFWSEGANEPLILNGIVYLLGQTRFTKEPVHEGDYHLDVSPDVAFLYRLIACPGMPFLALLLGVTVYIVRRR
ncbi:MAG TPA: hypothetical protein VFF73_08790, partial [Planctomycetota bacterium]|nr:hypothetical protein [Planctomycetota bacterium]